MNLIKLSNSYTLYFFLVFDHWTSVAYNCNIAIGGHLIENCQPQCWNLKKIKKMFHLFFHCLFPPETKSTFSCGFSLRLLMFQICTKGKSALTRLKLHWIDQDMSKCQTRKMSSIKPIAVVQCAAYPSMLLKHLFLLHFA